MTLRTLNYGNYGIFLIMGNAGFCPSAVLKSPDLNDAWHGAAQPSGRSCERDLRVGFRRHKFVFMFGFGFELRDSVYPLASSFLQCSSRHIAWSQDVGSKETRTTDPNQGR